MLLSLLLVALATLASLGQPFPLAILLNHFAPSSGRPPSLPERLFWRFAPHDLLTDILVLAMITLLLRLASESIGLLQGFLKIRIGYNGLLRVRCDLFQKLQQLSVRFYRARPQGDLIYRISSDTNGFVAGYNVINGLAVNAVTLVFMAWIMFSMNWRLAFVAVSITPILFWAIRKYGGVLSKTAQRATQIEAELATTVHRSVATIGLVQAFGREEDEYARFAGGVGRSSSAWVRMHMQGMIYWAVLGCCFGLGAALIFAYGGYLVLHNAMHVGDVTVFLTYVTAQLYAPLQALSSSETELRRGMAGMLRVYEIIDTEPEVKDAPDAMPLPRQPRVLQLERVDFAYQADVPVLRDVTVSVRPGEMVAFVGSSGAGKTSLLNLLPRFYDPVRGTIRLDGIDIRKVRLRDLRRHIALVLQESPILAATVAENIAYGNPNASDAQLREAARLAGAEPFIESLPQKFRSPLSEGGQDLSGGQRQRIGIARALATEAPILVLDEPTSALDAENEQMIVQTLRDLKGKRTIILVSHRLSTVADCDCIYVMEEGRVVEQGTHAQLLARSGVYFRMARHQLKLQGESLEV